MIKLISPENNAFIEQQMDCHLDHIFRQNELQKKEIQDPIDWLNLVATNEDRTFPTEILFEWEWSDFQENDSYKLMISYSYDTIDCNIIKFTKEPKISLNNFLLDVKFDWTVAVVRNEKVIATSEVFQFTTSDIPPRWLKVPNITNVRDIGGWKTMDHKTVKQGVIFRSSELNNNLSLTDEGIRILLDDLSIKSDIDLRGSGEAIGAVLDAPNPRRSKSAKKMGKSRTSKLIKMNVLNL